MVYPRRHQLVTFSWETPEAERAQTGFRLDQGAPLTQTEVNAIRDALKTFWAASSNLIDSVFILNEVKSATIDVNGQYPPDIDPVYAGTFSQGGGVTSGAVKYPLQVACVASLTTDVSRGLAHEGRMYLPPITNGLNASTFRWDTTAVGNRAAGVAVMLNNVNGLVTGPVTVFSKVGSGAFNPVRGVRVGNRADIQRSRDNAVPETYQMAAL